MALAQVAPREACRRCDTEACTPTPPDLLEGSLYRRSLPANLVDLTSVQGKSRFSQAFVAGTAEAFFPLVSQYQTQSHPAFCGFTTLTIILNALAIDPARVWMYPWRWFTESQLTCCVELDSAKTGGVTMDQLAQVGRCNGADVSVLRGLSEAAARTLLLDAVRQNEYFIAVSYSRKALGQTGSGHFSPVAAFDEASDSVLILDTARFKVSFDFIHFCIALLLTLCAVRSVLGEIQGFIRGDAPD